MTMIMMAKSMMIPLECIFDEKRAPAFDAAFDASKTDARGCVRHAHTRSYDEMILLPFIQYLPPLRFRMQVHSRLLIL